MDQKLRAYTGYFVCIVLLNVVFIQTFSQANTEYYRLIKGEKYYLSISMQQNTESVEHNFRKDVSLDVKYALIFELIDIEQDSNYIFQCSYDDLYISFFFPQSDLYVNSESRSTPSMSAFLSKLKMSEFKLKMSVLGEVCLITELDNRIDSILIDLPINNEPTEQVMVKTLREVFGADALAGVLNIALDIYGKNSGLKTTKKSSFYFNAQNIDIENTYFYQKNEDHTNRVQGIGVIEEITDTIAYRGLKLATSLKGSQTYDYLLSDETGWIIEGISKQRIYTISEIIETSELPKGLRIPALTVTEYNLSGGRGSKTEE
ncbi:MAG: hypothetical protein K9J30_03170 [Bacteroidales bacterium]|nr:hypothetical protein [Bacteroidales bacterium]